MEWIVAHPVLAAVIVVIILYLIFKIASSSSRGGRGYHGSDSLFDFDDFGGDSGCDCGD